MPTKFGDAVVEDGITGRFTYVITEELLSHLLHELDYLNNRHDFWARNPVITITEIMGPHDAFTDRFKAEITIDPPELPY